MKLSVREIALTWKSSISRAGNCARSCACKRVYTVCTLVCTRCKGLLSLWLCDIFWRKQRSRIHEMVRILKFVSIPDLKPRKEPQQTSRTCLYSGWRCWLEITPRYGRNLAVLRAQKALGGRRKTCPGRNDDWIRWFDGKWVGVKWRWRETDKQSKIEYACTGCIDLWERNLCWREMLFVSYTEDFPSSRIVQFFVSRLFSSLFNRESIFFRFLTRHRVASNVGIHRIFGEGRVICFIYAWRNVCKDQTRHFWSN